MIDTTELEADIQARINALAGTESVDELFSLTSALRALTSKSYVSVPTYADLPDLTTKPLPSGSLIFVQQLNILMMSVGNQWKSVDGRIYTPPKIAYAWGNNTYGILGNNTSGIGTDRSSPVTVVGGITTWSKISAGGYHSLGLTSAGVMYSWGANFNGFLGDGTGTDRSSPVTIAGGITTWSQVSAGAIHTAAITTGGVMYAWGKNSYGELGDNTTSSRSSPVTVVGGITTWSQVACGGHTGQAWGHSLALTSAGIMYAWGRNNYNALGDNTTTNRSSPVTVVGGITNWSQIQTGRGGSMGLTSTGIIYTWGSNILGMLGDGTDIDRSSPVTIVGGITNWNKITMRVGARHRAAITSSGVLYTWGINSQGAIGDGTTTHRSSPVTVAGGITNWSQVSAGRYRTIGVTSSGIAYAWGDNSNGILGDGTTTNRSSPVSVVGGITAWTQVDSGERHNLAIST